MKNKLTLLTLTALVLTFAFAAPQAEAKGNGHTYGKTSFPGNSLFGRMHNPHFMYKWGDENFENFDDLMAYVREQYMKRLYERYNWSTSYNSLVAVTTRSATTINEDSATLRGSIDLKDEDEATVWFEYGTRATQLSKETNEEKITSDDDFSEKISNLSSGTRYYFRAVAEREDGVMVRGTILSFITDASDSDAEEPVATTLAPQDITDDSALLRGKVEMNDSNNGRVFFVYGTSESKVEDVEDTYDQYADIQEDGVKLQRFSVDSDLDGTQVYEESVDDLDDNTEYFYRVGVEYKDEDGDRTLLFGDVRSFETD